MTRSRKVLLTVPAVVALGTGTALAARADLDISPKKAEVGDAVFARATHLKKGRYALFIVADRRPTLHSACVRRLTKRHRTDEHSVSFRAHVPKHLTCWENNSVRLGTVRTRPGRYHLIVAVPDGPAGYNVRFSFARHKFRVVSGD
jgi:hypothetical protein